MPAPSSNPSALRLRAVATPLLALLLVCTLAWSGALAPLDRGWFDSLQRTLAPRTLADSDTALVLINENTLEAMGSPKFAWRWPWPRQAFACLLAGLHRAGAKAVVVDLAFVELSGSEMDDTILGTVAAGMPGVTLASLGEDRLPAIWPPEFREAHAKLFAAPARWGSARARPDADGVYRRYPIGGSLVEAALGYESASGNEVSAPNLVRWRGSLKDVEARGVPVVPAAAFVDAGRTMLEAAFEHAPDFDPTALVAAIAAQPAPVGAVFDAVRDRTVFLGANAAATFDYIATPANAPEPGVLLHWNAWQNFAGDEFLADAPVWLIGAALVIAVALVAAVGRRGVSKPAWAAVGIGCATLGGSAAAFQLGTWFAPTAPVAGAAVTFTAVAVENFRRERARKREIQGWFGAYVSPAVVQRLVENPDALKLGGERREVTVFFSDLVGFTTLSEKLPADQLVTLVNTCLEELSGSVFDHGGYLDKYIGDAIMAVFGTPEELDNHALAAVRAALDAQRRLAALNERFARDYGGVRLGMRIGVNSGEAVVGNVGSERKKNYTALGDTVNLGSRLESANNFFRTSILLGPLTASRVAGAIVTRPVARLRVKGKTQAVDVHEPLGEIATLDEATRRFAAIWRAGYDAYGARRFAEAAQAFREAVDLRPDDFLATRYLSDVRRLAASPPPEDWEPTLNLETK